MAHGEEEYSLRSNSRKDISNSNNGVPIIRARSRSSSRNQNDVDIDSQSSKPKQSLSSVPSSPRSSRREPTNNHTNNNSSSTRSSRSTRDPIANDSNSSSSRKPTSKTSIPLPSAVGIKIPLEDKIPDSSSRSPKSSLSKSSTFGSRNIQPSLSLDNIKGPTFSLENPSGGSPKSESSPTSSRSPALSRYHSNTQLRSSTNHSHSASVSSGLNRPRRSETHVEASLNSNSISRRSRSRDRSSSNSKVDFDEMLKSLEDVSIQQSSRHIHSASISRSKTSTNRPRTDSSSSNGPRSADVNEMAESLDKLINSSKASSAGSTRQRALRPANSLNTIDASPMASPLGKNDNPNETEPASAGIGAKLGNWFNFSRKDSADSINSAASNESSESNKRESYESRVAKLDPEDPKYEKKLAREKERERRYRIAELEQELAEEDAKERAESDLKRIEEREQELERKKMERVVREEEEAEERRKDREFSEYDKDLAKAKREQRKIHEDRANADRRELALIAAARQKEGEIISRKAVNLIPRGQIDERSIDPGFIKAVMTFVKKDNVMPNPEDFLSSDGFEFYMDTVGMTFGEILNDYLEARFQQRPNNSQISKPVAEFDAVDIKLSVIEARGLIAKEGRTRDAYCSVELGAIPPDGSDAFIKWDKRKDRTVFNTDPKTGTLNPKWNQHIPIQAKTLMDSIMITVIDSGKEQFLGRVRLSYAEIITAAAREGIFKRWIHLKPATNKSKDKNKYVGGELLVVAEIKDNYGGLGTSRDARGPGESKVPEDPVATLHKELLQTSLDFRAMYRTLLKGCLNLDLKVSQSKINDNTYDLLSHESKSILKILGRSWRVSDSYMTISYLDLIFEKYCESGKAPLIAVLSAYERLKEDIRSNPNQFEGHERQSAEDVLNKMYTHFKDQLCKYKEFFPKNQPKGALETTVLIMRMIYKNKIFIDNHSELPPSFRDELKNLLTEAGIKRYNKLRELTAPFDEQDTEAVVNGIIGLAEQVCNEIDEDANYFQAPFQRELDIVRLTAETYLKYFVLTLETTSDLLEQEDAVLNAGKAIFDLYRLVRMIDDKYVNLVPGLKRMSSNSGFSVERWFAPFVVSWLEHLSRRTLEWVNNAVYNDNWQPLDESTSSERHHSSSIKDVFTAIYQELEFLTDLHWSHHVQNAGFLQLFSKSLSSAMDQYCIAVSLGELQSKKDSKQEQTLGGINWSSYLSTGRKGAAPVDISSVSCIKLCNIEYAMAKLDGLYRHMNAPAASKIIKEYKKSISSGKPTTQEEFNQLDTITGSFRLQIAYGEDIKGVNKNGSSNPYLVVSVPDGTEVYPEESLASTKKKNSGKIVVHKQGETEKVDDDEDDEEKLKPIILTGAACELAKSRVINDSINPTWDEAFAIMLPHVKSIELEVLSKNFITSDDSLGSAVLNLSKGTRLRKRLLDFQTHDIFVELEPQGRVMLRMTMEGSDDDIDFWFRKAKERLGRTRNDFVRHLVTRIMPYIRNIFLKSLKDQEAAAVASNFFQSLTSSAEYSDRTANGAFVTDPMPISEADTTIDPIIEYLNRNLATLTDYLSVRLAQEVIRRCWEEILSMMEHALVPQLFGAVEKDRRILNNRQTSLMKFTIQELKVFFNAEGAEMGLPLKLLESRKYNDCMILIEKYQQDIKRNKREYELELLKGKDRETLIRLIRLKIERLPSNEYPEELKHADREWIDQQISRRKDLARR